MFRQERRIDAPKVYRHLWKLNPVVVDRFPNRLPRPAEETRYVDLVRLLRWISLAAYKFRSGSSVFEECREL